MSIVVSDTPRIIGIDVTDDSIVAQLADGRSISVPLIVVLAIIGCHAGTTEQFRDHWEWVECRWPDIDEDAQRNRDALRHTGPTSKGIRSAQRAATTGTDRGTRLVVCSAGQGSGPILGSIDGVKIGLARGRYE